MSPVLWWICVPTTLSSHLLYEACEQAGNSSTLLLLCDFVSFWRRWIVLQLHFIISLPIKQRMRVINTKKQLLFNNSWQNSVTWCDISAFWVSQCLSHSLWGHLWQGWEIVRQSDVELPSLSLSSTPFWSVPWNVTLCWHWECVSVCFCTLPEPIRKRGPQKASDVKGPHVDALETHCKKTPASLSVLLLAFYIMWSRV